ncbi:PAS domain S-box protein [Martelella mangrovi]|uniref:histidine kinase n=1 Tax=Martelella mangrovi TaxID=1397477 RepID=A0ABV2IEE9_9HYPH
MKSRTAETGSFGEAALNILPDGRISYWSHGAQRLFGYTAAEIVDCSLFDRLVAPEHASALRKHVEGAAPGMDAVSVGFSCVHRDNRVIDVSAVIAPIVGAGGTIDGFTMMVEDTAIRSGYADRLVAIIEAMPTGVLVVDEAGSVDMVNRHFEYLSGYARDELKGMKVERLVPDSHRAAHAGYRTRYNENPVPRLMGNGRDLKLRRADGTEIPVEIGLSALAVPSGKQVLALVTDISQRVETERRMSRQQAELERSVEELSTFAYVASHDLKSPLRGVIQIAQWIEEDIADRETVTGHLNLLRNRIGRMERLLNDLLAYSRAGRGAGGRGRVDVQAMARDIFELLAPPAGMTLQLEGEMPTFETLRTPLEQILHNLFSNAIKHHDRPAEGTITLSCRHVSPFFFEFTVIDDGPGIAPQYHDRVFGMFQTLRPRDEVEGSGIGLALVRKIVTTFGGRIWIGSGEGRGCAIHFTWPRVIESEDVNEQ